MPNGSTAPSKAVVISPALAVLAGPTLASMRVARTLVNQAEIDPLEIA